MKQEIKYLIASTLLAIIIVLGVCSIAYNVKIHNKSINLYLDKIDGLKTQIDTSALTNYNALADRIEALSRDNERLTSENAALKDEIREFGWLKEASKNIK